MQFEPANPYSLLLLNSKVKSPLGDSYREKGDPWHGMISVSTWVASTVTLLTDPTGRGLSEGLC